MDARKWVPVFLTVVLTMATARAGLEHDSLPGADTALEDTAPTAPEPEPVEAPAARVTVPVQEKAGSRTIGTFASFGMSDGKVLAASIGTDIHFGRQWNPGPHGRITTYGEFLLGYWEGEEGHTGVTSLHEAGVSFFARYRHLHSPLSWIRPFADLGAGLHYLTEDRIENKELGRHWQAGSNIGVGILFGREERLEIGVRLRHLSNAGTDEINWGVNQIQGRIGLRF